MKRAPLYRALQEQAPKLGGAGHAGLWFDRFFDQYDDAQWSVPTDAKCAFLRNLTHRTSCGDAATLGRHLDRRSGLVQALGGQSRAFASDWHWVTGMGLPHPVENGFSWHPTLGVPYLPGSGVKASRSCHAWATGPTLWTNR